MNIATALAHLFPNADHSNDYRVESRRGVEKIAYFNPALGPVPSKLALEQAFAAATASKALRDKNQADAKTECKALVAELTAGTLTPQRQLLLLKHIVKSLKLGS